MEQARGQAFQRFGVLSVVLGGHVLFVLLLSSSRPSDTRKGITRTESDTFLMLDLESRVEQPALEQSTEIRPDVSASRTSADRPRKSRTIASSEPSGEAGESTAINPGEGRGIPKIDWHAEMEAAVETVSPTLIKEYVQRCADAERAHAPRPPGCPRRSYDGPWRPSGNIVQDMRDPDRPRSSVPDPLPPAFPKAPRSKVIQGEE